MPFGATRRGFESHPLRHRPGDEPLDESVPEPTPRRVPLTVVAAGVLLIVHAVAWLVIVLAAAGVGAGLNPVVLEFLLIGALVALLPAGAGIILGARWGAILFGLGAAAGVAAIVISIAASTSGPRIDGGTALFLLAFVAVPAVVALVLWTHRRVFRAR
jgi:hypothetical protein